MYVRLSETGGLDFRSNAICTYSTVQKMLGAPVGSLERHLEGAWYAAHLKYTAGRYALHGTGTELSNYSEESPRNKPFFLLMLHFFSLFCRGMGIGESGETVPMGVLADLEGSYT